MGAELTVARVARQHVCVIFSRAGADTQALMRMARRAAKAGTGVEVLLLDFGRADPVLGEIADGVPLKRFWREAPRGGGGAEPLPPDAGLTPGPMPGTRGGEWRSGYYRDGLPVLAMSVRNGITVVDHFDSSGVPVRHDDIDERGRWVRTVDLDPVTRRETNYRYLDSDGACWLSVWVDPRDGSLGRAVQHRPVEREFGDLREAQVDWVAEELRGIERPRVLVFGTGARRIVDLLSRAAAAATTDEESLPLP